MFFITQNLKILLPGGCSPLINFSELHLFTKKDRLSRSNYVTYLFFILFIFNLVKVDYYNL